MYEYRVIQKMVRLEDDNQDLRHTVTNLIQRLEGTLLIFIFYDGLNRLVATLFIAAILLLVNHRMCYLFNSCMNDLQMCVIV